MPTRKANAQWDGGLKGKGQVKTESGALDTGYAFATRFGDEKGSNPEELLAAAEAACFSMALALGLEGAGTPATSIATDAACTVEKQGAGFKITTMALTVRGTVPGIDQAKFQEIAEKTKATCPVSVALAGVQISVQATLG